MLTSCNIRRAHTCLHVPLMKSLRLTETQDTFRKLQLNTQWDLNIRPWPSFLPTTLFCLLINWQISLAAAIWAFSPSKVPRVARSMKETQQRQEMTSAGYCVTRAWDTHSMRRERRQETCLSNHAPPRMDTNTTHVCLREKTGVNHFKVINWNWSNNIKLTYIK